MPVISLSVDKNKVGLLTIERPEVRNALNWEAMDQFSHSIRQVNEMDGIKGLILHGVGGDFSTGGDLRELHLFDSFEDGIRLASHMSDSLSQLERLPFPTIAAIEGYALGGGAEIALACDFRIMAENAIFGMIQIKLGLIPAWGGVRRLAHLVGPGRAKDICLSANLVNAEQSLKLGLATKIVKEGHALQAAKETMNEMLMFYPRAIQTLKEMLAKSSTISTQIQLENHHQFATLWTSDHHRQAAQSILDSSTTSK